jgi:hypothetical protein
MSVEDIGDWTNPNASNRGFVRSALILAGSTLAIAAPLCLFAIVTAQPGLGGPWGVAAAAAVCLFAGWAADAVAAIVQRFAPPHAALLSAMAVRSSPPLLVCMLLAVQGGGREHLAFVVYLLTFYLVVLTLDTWWAVRRVADASSQSNRSSS